MDVSAVGTVSKTSRGRGKGGKGGGVSSGQGERTTETVSHTVPNMAAADQFPINRLPGTLDQHKQNSFFSFFLPRFVGNVPRKKNEKKTKEVTRSTQPGNRI